MPLRWVALITVCMLTGLFVAVVNIATVLILSQGLACFVDTGHEATETLSVEAPRDRELSGRLRR